MKLLPGLLIMPPYSKCLKSVLTVSDDSLFTVACQYYGLSSEMYRQMLYLERKSVSTPTFGSVHCCTCCVWLHCRHCDINLQGRYHSVYRGNSMKGIHLCFKQIVQMFQPGCEMLKTIRGLMYYKL